MNIQSSPEQEYLDGYYSNSGNDNYHSSRPYESRTSRYSPYVYSAGQSPTWSTESQLSELSSASTSRLVPCKTRQSTTWVRPERQPSPYSPPKSKVRLAPKSKTNLYIRGIGENATEDSLKEMIKEFGPTKSVKAIRFPGQDVCKGKFYIELRFI